MEVVSEQGQVVICVLAVSGPEFVLLFLGVFLLSLYLVQGIGGER